MKNQISKNNKANRNNPNNQRYIQNEKMKNEIERNFETDNKEIARLVSEGFMSGILDNEAGYRLVWELKKNFIYDKLEMGDTQITSERRDNIVV